MHSKLESYIRIKTKTCFMRRERKHEREGEDEGGKGLGFHPKLYMTHVQSRRHEATAVPADQVPEAPSPAVVACHSKHTKGASTPSGGVPSRRCHSESL